MTKSKTDKPESEVTVIGEKKLRLQQINADIDRLVGHESNLYGEDAIRKEGSNYVRCPNYCGNARITREELAKLDVFPLTLSDTLKNHSLSFTHEGKDYFVIPQASHSLALAIALRSVLSLRVLEED